MTTSEHSPTEPERQTESTVSLVEQIMAARETVSPELRAKRRRLLEILSGARGPEPSKSVRGARQAPRGSQPRPLEVAAAGRYSQPIQPS